MAATPSSPTPGAARHDEAALARTWARMARAEGPPWLHDEVARRMAERLPIIKTAPEAWLAWSAHAGGGLDALRAAYPKARGFVAEPDDALAERSRARAAAGLRWWRRRAGFELVQGDAATPAPVQLLWSNMALHLAADTEAWFARWHALLAPGGFLMFSTFGPDTLRELRALYAEAGWGDAHPGFIDMHDLGDQLVHAGFADPVMDQEAVRLNWSAPEAALTELRTLGANTHPARHAGLRTPRWRTRLAEAMARRRGPDGRIALTFEIVYGHAFRVERTPRSEGPATVSLDALKATLPAASRRRNGP